MTSPSRPGLQGGSDPATLPARLERCWRDGGWSRPGDRIAVACSGGTDSLSLLHVLRFHFPGFGIRLEVAHFDHGMRPESRDEAEWLGGVAASWGIPMHSGRAVEPPGDEAGARTQRYRFLESLLRDGGLDRVLTAHHADDQVETVLFRILRGTGVAGLRGIPEHRAPGILRPLLSVSRAEIEAYARENRLNPRSDPTNRSLRFARGRVRERILPLLETVHPGAREGLLRLTRNAARTTAALDVLLRPVMDSVLLAGDLGSGEGEASVLDRDRFLDLDPHVQAELFRLLTSARGTPPSEAGTAAALQFIRTGSSGGVVQLGTGVAISREFGRIVFDWEGSRSEPEGSGLEHDRTRSEAGRPGETGLAPPGAGEFVLPSPESGEGTFRLRGIRYRIRWGVAGPGPDPGWPSGHRAVFQTGDVDFPLRIRGWRAGDRTRTTGGTKKLKKLFGELGIPVRDRGRLPLLVDAAGQVLWIPGHHLAGIPGSQGSSSRRSSGEEFEILLARVGEG